MLLLLSDIEGRLSAGKGIVAVGLGAGVRGGTAVVVARASSYRCCGRVGVGGRVGLGSGKEVTLSVFVEIICGWGALANRKATACTPTSVQVASMSSSHFGVEIVYVKQPTNRR